MNQYSIRSAIFFLISSVQGLLGQTTDYQDFFSAVQMQSVFPDSKTFPDCIPKYPISEILKKYKLEKVKPNFNLNEFIVTNYYLPKNYASGYLTDTTFSTENHINSLWGVLTREPEKNMEGSSLLRLPHPYVVPGGRFGEVYYWDSYFTMLGLEVSGKTELINNMVDNFAYLIDSVGFIPNGNRKYYLSRSQPPFFAMMVNLLAGIKGDVTYQKYLPQMEKEYQFWMNGTEKLSSKTHAFRRVVKLPDNEILNRYYDDSATPRAESYKEDVELAKKYSGNKEDFYRNIKAACESGWDFSSRWFRDGKNLYTIHTTEIVPVDLNSLLCNVEIILSKSYGLKGDSEKEKYYLKLSEKRRLAIFKYCWDKEAKFFTDYDFVTKEQKKTYSLAGMYPFFFNLHIGMAQSVADRIEKDFLQTGGLLTTPIDTHQQWDAPNGWAPLQWIAYKGLKTNGFDQLADEIKKRWIATNEKVYKQTGKMVEKYNVVEKGLKAGGGEYPLQDGFGWTNGVFLKMKAEK